MCSLHCTLKESGGVCVCVCERDGGEQKVYETLKRGGDEKSFGFRRQTASFVGIALLFGQAIWLQTLKLLG